jgi:subtilisin family serine protease
VAADIAASRGILVVTAASNNGPGSRTIWTPADGDSVLAIGAEDSLGNIAFFSSRGPTADGRIKPDFTAPGVAVCVVTGIGRVLRLNGTSFATPLLAASAALLKQLQPTLTPIGVRTAFRNVGSNRATPDTIRGGAARRQRSRGLPSWRHPITPLRQPALTTVLAFRGLWDRSAIGNRELPVASPATARSPRRSWTQW